MWIVQIGHESCSTNCLPPNGPCDRPPPSPDACAFLISGIDLVQAQIRISGGESLAEIGIPNQASISTRGYAIQSSSASYNGGR